MPSSEIEIFGFDTKEIGEMRHRYSSLASDCAGWKFVYDTKFKWISDFCCRHNPIEILSTLATVWHVQGEPNNALDPAVEQVDVEIFQALCLKIRSEHKHVPCSPKHFEDFYPNLGAFVHSFVQKQKDRDDYSNVQNYVVRGVRTQTVHYRNIFYQHDCDFLIDHFAEKLDRKFVEEFDFTLKDVFDLLREILSVVTSNMEQNRVLLRRCLAAVDINEALGVITELCELAPQARRTWKICEKRCIHLDDYRSAAHQIFYISQSWVYKVSINDVNSLLRPKFGSIIEKVSLTLGSLTDFDKEKFFMNNPIRERPIISLSENVAFAPLPNLFYSFPFQIIEGLISGKQTLQTQYEETRAKYLELEIFRTIQHALPSAQIFSNVEWLDPVSGKEFENDILVLIGNTIIVFEAKSGRLDQAGRRGAVKSLFRNFTELFIEPGIQASRLEFYLNQSGSEARLWSKSTHEKIDLRMAKPKIVYKISICLEHYGILTSAKKNLVELGLIQDKTAWAPVISLGELQMIGRFLDSEISFFHYLTRRAVLESDVQFVGDEMDLLSVYLTNGLYLEPEKLKGQTLFFSGVDEILRGVKKRSKFAQAEM